MPGSSDGSYRRVVLIAAAALVLAGGVSAAVLALNDSGSDEAPPETAVSGAPPLDADSEQPGNGEAGKPGSGRGESNADKRDKPADRRRAKRNPSDEPASEKKGLTGCPPGIGRAQCRALGEALAEATGTPTKEGACPPGISRAQCRALGKALEQATGTPTKDDECPPGISEEQCAALGEALKPD